MRISLAIIISLIASYIFARSLIRPIQRLQQRTHNVFEQLNNSDNIDYEPYLKTSRQDELGQLNKDIAGMCRKLQENSQNKTTVKRYRSRTKSTIVSAKPSMRNA